MLTWLDWYTEGYVESLRKMLLAMGGDPNMMCKEVFGQRLDQMTDLDAMRAKLMMTVGASESLDPNDGGGNIASYEQFLLPFALKPGDLRDLATDGNPLPATFRAIAVQPSADLVAALSRAKPPSGQESAVRREFEAGTWFVDLPHRAILVGGLEVRALFVQPSPTLGTIAICAVLTEPGSNRTAGRMVWLMGDRVHDIPGLADREVDRRLLQDEVEDFLALLALYRVHADKAQRGTLPRLTREQATGRKAKQHAKKNSMFAVETLAPPADRFGRAGGTGQGGWRLGWNSQVTAHFKMQPHGPQSSLRKLIYVDGYARGPEDAPVRRKIERLDLDAR